MSTKHKPATPLPWEFYEELQLIRGVPMSGDNQAYIAHAANAYPRLIAAVHNLLALVDGNPRSADLARALLRELGEE